MSVGQTDRELGAPSLRVAGRNNGEPPRGLLAQKELHVSSQQQALLSQAIDSSFRKNIHRGAERSQRQNRRVAKLPAFSSRNGVEIGAHLETHSLIMSPPSGVPRP